MAFSDWLLGPFTGGAELREVRRRFRRLQRESFAKSRELDRLNKRRDFYMDRLRSAPNDEFARPWSQQLHALDDEERSARARWNEIEGELQQCNEALQNLRSMPNVNVKRIEADQRRLAKLQEERAQQHVAKAEIGRETQARQTAAANAFQQATQRTTPDQYMDLRHASKGQSTASGQVPAPQRPAAPQTEERRDKS